MGAVVMMVEWLERTGVMWKTIMVNDSCHSLPIASLPPPTPFSAHPRM